MAVETSEPSLGIAIYSRVIATARYRVGKFTAAIILWFTFKKSG